MRGDAPRAPAAWASARRHVHARGGASGRPTATMDIVGGMRANGRWIVGLAAALALAACRGDAPERGDPPERRTTAEQGRDETLAPVPSQAAERAPAESGRLVEAAALPIEGTVVSLDDESLVLRGGAEESHEFVVDEWTRLVGPGGERVGREAFREGTRVQAHYAQRDEGMVVVELRVADPARSGAAGGDPSGERR